MLHKTFNSAKCKTSLKLASSRIKLLRNKRQVHAKQLKNDVAQLLQTDQTQTAMIRVEHVTREAKTMAAYDLLAVFCEQIAANINVIESQKICPINLKEAIASVVFAVSRCSDLPELTEVMKQFTRKYGKQFTSSILELRPESGVSRKLIENLSPNTADGPTKVKLLTAIAEEYSIKWVYKAFDDDNAASSSNTMGQSSFHHIQENVPLIPPMPRTQQETGSYSEQKFHEASSAQKHELRESLGSGKWKKEFKDASEAAQAAADSAELASMAAKAAVELARNQMLESNANDMREQLPFERKKSEVKYEELSDEEIIARFNRLKGLPQDSNVKEPFQVDSNAAPDFAESVITSKQNSFNSSTPQPVIGSKPNSFNTSSPQPVIGSKPHSFSSSTPQPVIGSKPNSFNTSTPQSVIGSKPNSFNSSTPQPVMGSKLNSFNSSTPQPVIGSKLNSFNSSTPQPVIGSKLNSFSSSTPQPAIGSKSNSFNSSNVIGSKPNSFGSDEDLRTASYDEYGQTEDAISDEPGSMTMSGRKDEVYPRWDSFNEPSSLFSGQQEEEIESELHNEIFKRGKSSSETEEEMADLKNEPKFDEYVNMEESSVHADGSWFDKPSSSFSGKQAEEIESEVHQQLFDPEKSSSETENEMDDLEDGPNFDEFVKVDESSVEKNESWFDTGKLSGGFRHKPIVRPTYTKKSTSVSSIEIDAVTEELLNKEILLPDSSDDEAPKPKTPEVELSTKAIALSSDSTDDELPKPKSTTTRPKQSVQSSRNQNFFDSEEDEDEKAKAVITPKNRLKNLPSRRTKQDAHPNPAKPIAENLRNDKTSVRKQSLPSLMRDEAWNPETVPSSSKSKRTDTTSSDGVLAEAIKTRSRLEGSSSIKGQVAGNDAVRADKKSSLPTRSESTADMERSSSIEKKMGRVWHDSNVEASKKAASSLGSEAQSRRTSLESIEAVGEKEKSGLTERKMARAWQDTNHRQGISLGSKKLQSPLRNETTSNKDKQVDRVQHGKESSKDKEQEASRVEPAMHHSSEETGAAKSATKDTADQNLNKKASHVHPKLPDYDDLANFLRQNRTST